MKQKFSNFSYTLLESTSTYFKEVMVTFNYEGITYHRFLFIRKGLNVNYINEAKEIIKKEIENGTLLKNTNKQKKNKNPLLVFLATAFALTSITFAGLFTYQYLTSTSTPGGGDDPTIVFTKEDFNKALSMQGVNALRTENASVVESKDYSITYKVLDNRDYNIGYYHIGVHEVLPTNDNYDDKYFNMKGDECYKYSKEKVFGLYTKEVAESDCIITPEQLAKFDAEDEGFELTKLKYEDFNITQKDGKIMANSNKPVSIYTPAFRVCLNMDETLIEFNSKKQLTTLHAKAFVEGEGNIENVFNFKYDEYEPFIPAVGEFYHQLGDGTEGSEEQEFKETLTRIYPLVNGENVPVHVECNSNENEKNRFTYEYDRNRIALSYDGDELSSYYNQEDDETFYSYEYDEYGEYTKQEIEPEIYKAKVYENHFLKNDLGILQEEGGFNHEWDFGNFVYNNTTGMYTLKSVESVPITIKIPFLNNHECDVQISFKGTLLEEGRENRIERILIRDTEDLIDFSIEFEHYGVEIFLPDDF